jgi:uncharacterized membrane protein YccC
MSSNRPDPNDFLDQAQRMLRELFGGERREDEPRTAAARGLRPDELRENLTFALATRAVEALEDVALNVAAIRQRLERMDAEAARERPESEG